MSRPLRKPKPHTRVVVYRPWEMSGRLIHQFAEGTTDSDGKYALRLVCERIARHPEEHWRWGWMRYDLLDPTIPLCSGCWAAVGGEGQ